MSLEEFIRNNAIIPNSENISGSGYELKIWIGNKNELVIYTHPSGRDGDTVYFKVKGNTLIQWFQDKNEMKLNTVKERLE